MELVRGCHLVGSGRLGFELTNRWDGHVYLLCSRGEALLVDSGCGRDPDAVARRVDRALAGSTRLVGIVLTHGHVDHSGGAAALSACYDVPVYVHPSGVPALMSGDEERTNLARARGAGVYPHDQVLVPVPAARALPQKRLTVGDLEVEAVYTPGHSYDHVVYAVDLPDGRAAFTGDLLFARGRIAASAMPDTDLAAYAASVRAIADLGPDLLFPGHAEVVLGNARDHVALAAQAWDEFRLPTQLVP